jgi:metallo-beta-lactamase family protein
LITHAHLDHIGRIPKLVKEGFKGTIYTTEASAELAEIIFLDSAKIMKEDYETRYKKAQRRGSEEEERLPLYGEEDIEATFDLDWYICEYENPVSLEEGSLSPTVMRVISWGLHS